MKELALASGNAGKLREFDRLLAPLGVQVVSQGELGIEGAEETGVTFVENALLKARGVCQACDLACLADDSGIVVPGLNGEPGIFSARYAGAHGDSEANNAKLLAALSGQDDRHAYFYCALVFMRYATDPAPVIATATWHGTIATAPAGSEGFGYDPIFMPIGSNVSAAELSAERKAEQSHRGQAMAQLMPALEREFSDNAPAL
ncbi:MAG: RdgB/HAM1 family non-canonical purine NTP pyrophosphatase [Pseudomonadaceae bacterium]|nr:RdgB/HAM1 family non-canonical purine NTP pyrophosphatase [Pseudomonadaceae bacterium]